MTSMQKIIDAAERCASAIEDGIDADVARLRAEALRKLIAGYSPSFGQATVTIWTASADADGGNQGHSFATEREAEDWILNLLDSDASREGLDAYLADPAREEDDGNFFDYVDEHKCDPSLDTFNLDSKVLEVDLIDMQLAKPRIVVALEGGMCSGVCADTPVEVCVIDYDTDGAEAEDLMAIPQSGGGTAEATGHISSVDLDPLWTEDAFETVRAHWGEEHQPSAAAADIARHEAAIAEHGIAGALESALGTIDNVSWTPPCKVMAAPPIAFQPAPLSEYRKRLMELLAESFLLANSTNNPGADTPGILNLMQRRTAELLTNLITALQTEALAREGGEG